MAQWVHPDLIKTARQADLYSFLLRNHRQDIELEGNTIRLRSNHSLTLKEGYSGWKDWATGETGNGIDLLTNYFGYDLQSAVESLCGSSGISAGLPQQPKSCKAAMDPRVFSPPVPLQGPYRQLYAYLTQTRGIPAEMVQRLIDDRILYQAADHANMVFINPAGTFAEVRGTNTFSPYHQVQFSDPAAFWWFKTNGLFSDATVAFVCEAAIDAISLYLLRKDKYPGENGLYCSIGGVANQQRIDAIKSGMAAAGLQTVIAVDNDNAGEKCRQKNSDCPYLIPSGAKDWNEMLMNERRS